MLLADGPGREQAQQLAQEELAKQPYQDARPSGALRALGRLRGWVDDLFDKTSGGLGDNTLALVGLVIVLVAITIVVLVRLGPMSGGTGRRTAVFDDDAPTAAADHRAAAEAFAAAGAFAEAVRERLRAIVRELEARGLLDARPGRTADEVAGDAGAAVPGLAAPLQQAAHVFDEIWYGGRTATREDHELMVAVDAQVTVARTVPV